MAVYLARRLLLLLLVVWGVSTISFLVVRALPGDVSTAVSAAAEGGVAPSLETAREVRRQLGLDRPLFTQYVEWLSRLARMDPGTSLWTGRPVLAELGGALPVTLELTVLAVLLAWALALPLGLLSAVRRNTPVDYLFRLLALSGLALPSFWVGILALLALSTWAGWLPSLAYIPFTRDPLGNLAQFIIPALVLGWRGAAVGGRMVRSATLEALGQDFVRTARAKGLPEGVVLLRHVLRNSALPVVTVGGFQVVALLGGAVVVEEVFNLPGLGRALVQAVAHRDYPVVQFLMTAFAFVAAGVNLVVDLVYLWLDPRIRFR